jgi:hypothetical protein
MVQCIHYRSGYKYQLAGTVSVSTKLEPDNEVSIDDFITLRVDGMLEIRKGYAWDGPSGPTIDTKTFMRGSLVHDALYQLMRAELLGGEWRKAADEELHTICRADGMNPIRAWWVLRALRRHAGPAASPESRKKEHSAPRNCDDSSQ